MNEKAKSGGKNKKVSKKGTKKEAAKPVSV